MFSRHKQARQGQGIDSDSPAVQRLNEQCYMRTMTRRETLHPKETGLRPQIAGEVLYLPHSMFVVEYQRGRTNGKQKVLSFCLHTNPD